MRNLTFADGVIRLNGAELPGVLTSLSIDGQVKFDEQNIDGLSGKNKVPQGWEDHAISATLILLTDDISDCYQKLAQLSPFFKDTDPKANPQIYAFASRHGQARGVRMVVFDRLETRESNKDNTIQATLKFTEHRPPVIRVEASVNKTPLPGDVETESSEGGSGVDGPQEDDSITIGVE